MFAFSSVRGKVSGTRESFAAGTSTGSDPSLPRRPSSHLADCASLHLRILSFGSKAPDWVSDASSSRAFSSPK
eukprot:2814332-Pleurochrysis_carterae.AAC.1